MFKKNSRFLIFLFAFALGFGIFSQNANAQAEHVIDLGTVANSVDETNYFDFGGFAKLNGYKTVDSIAVTIRATGELDIDSLEVYPGIVTENDRTYSSTNIHFAVTLNLAAAVEGVERLFTSGASIALSALRGYNTFKIVTRGATAGNDPTDPNDAQIIFIVYGH